MNKQDTFGPCCGNHCAKDQLQCEKGKHYFQQGQRSFPDESEMNLDKKVIFKLRQCGHFLHHGQGQANLDCLSAQQKEEIIDILTICLNHWE